MLVVERCLRLNASMLNFLPITLGLRYIRSRRRNQFISFVSAFSLLGMAFGVMALITVMSVMNGFREELLSKILGLNGHFSVYPIERQFTDYEQTVVELEQVDGVLHAIAFVEGQALASGPGGESTGVSVRGMDLQSIEKLELLRDSASLGGWDAWDESDGVAIGSRLAQKLGVTIGDPVTVVNPNGTITPFGKTPQIRSYPVNVIFNLGMVEFDSFYLYMPLEQAQTYFKLYEDRLRPGVEPPGVMATDEEIEAAYPNDPERQELARYISDPSGWGSDGQEGSICTSKRGNPGLLDTMSFLSLEISYKFKRKPSRRSFVSL